LSNSGIRRLLRKLAGMPNERPAKALFVAFSVSFVCALVVSTAAVLLEPFQAANRERDRQQRILEIVQRLPGSEELLGEAGTANIRTDIVELATGHIVRSMDAALYDQRKAATDPHQSIAVPAEHDIAGIRRRAKFAPVTLVERDGRIESRSASSSTPKLPGSAPSSIHPNGWPNGPGGWCATRLGRSGSVW